MINSILRFGLLFIILILLQVLLFNNIQFSGYINPYVYLMFIILLPVEIPSWILLLLSFGTGLIVALRIRFAPRFDTTLAGSCRLLIRYHLHHRTRFDRGSAANLEWRRRHGRLAAGHGHYLIKSGTRPRARGPSWKSKPWLPTVPARCGRTSPARSMRLACVTWSK